MTWLRSRAVQAITHAELEPISLAVKAVWPQQVRLWGAQPCGLGLPSTFIPTRMKTRLRTSFTKSFSIALDTVFPCAVSPCAVSRALSHAKRSCWAVWLSTIAFKQRSRLWQQCSHQRKHYSRVCRRGAGRLQRLLTWPLAARDTEDAASCLSRVRPQNIDIDWGKFFWLVGVFREYPLSHTKRC